MKGNWRYTKGKDYYLLWSMSGDVKRVKTKKEAVRLRKKLNEISGGEHGK